MDHDLRTGLRFRALWIPFAKNHGTILAPCLTGCFLLDDFSEDRLSRLNKNIALACEWSGSSNPVRKFLLALHDNLWICFLFQIGDFVVDFFVQPDVLLDTLFELVERSGTEEESYKQRTVQNK